MNDTLQYDGTNIRHIEHYFTKPKGLVFCARCGNLVDHTYQHNTCKKCLVKIFAALRPVIDQNRRGGFSLEAGCGR